VSQEIDLLGVIAMLGLFITGFLMWVAWELIIERKALALFLAIACFSLVWWLAGQFGLGSPLILLLIEATVTLLLLQVGRKIRAD
jgi:hypothetical protein